MTCAPQRMLLGQESERVCTLQRRHLGIGNNAGQLSDTAISPCICQPLALPRHRLVITICVYIIPPLAMHRFTALFPSLITLSAAHALAQAGPPLDNDFIIFRNGTHISIPHVDGTKEAHPDLLGEFSIRYSYSDWSYQSFGWKADVGVDLTGNQRSADILHLKLKVDPANAGKDNTFIMLEDKTDGQSGDLPMRLVWRVPESMKDGNWHVLDIPLPPERCAVLASLRGTLGLGDYWWYGGSWTTATQRVGGYDDLCGNTTVNPQYWKEFEWTNVKSLGAFWDHDSGAGSIWFDDVYVGATGLDLIIADIAPAAVYNVQVDANDEGNRIVWDSYAVLTAYKIYGSSNSFTNVTADGVFQIATFSHAFGGGILMHYLQFLHPNYAPDGSNPLVYKPYYAITSISQYGVENKDITNSLVNALNTELQTGPLILELTDAEADELLTGITTGNVSGIAFHSDWLPFELPRRRSNLKMADAQGPPDDDDLSGSFWLGYTRLNELWIYAEVKDEEVVLPSTGVADPWNYDTIEIGWANYDVRDDGGDVIFGTPHHDMQRGAHADYHFRIGGRDGGASAFAEVVTPSVGEVGGAVYSPWMDANGAQVGYKILAFMPLDAIQLANTGDALVDPPKSGEDPRIMAAVIALNDRDAGFRQSQIHSSLKYNANGQWWNTPAQWETVAMSPRDQHPIATESELPTGFSLLQNYPNPFNPQTSITFTLASPERVTLAVHDALGRAVATLLSGQRLIAGSHTVPFHAGSLASGVYVYRLKAGTTFSQSMRMTLLK